MVPLLLSCAALLTGCAPKTITKTVIVTEWRVPELPPALLACKDAPVAVGQNATQRDAAAALVKLDSSRAECSAKLYAIGRINKAQVKAAAEANAENGLDSMVSETLGQLH